MEQLEDKGTTRGQYEHDPHLYSPVRPVRVFGLMPSSRTNRTLTPPPPMVVLVGWLVPGAGYWLIGQRSRGAVVGVAILILVALGMLIGGIRVVDSAFIESEKEHAERVEREQTDANRNPPVTSPNLPQRVLQKPWFIGQFFAGPVALISDWIGATWERKDAPEQDNRDESFARRKPINAGAPFSHARVYEIGVLYTAVAGMLNLMAIIDSAYRAANGGAR